MKLKTNFKSGGLTSNHSQASMFVTKKIGVGIGAMTLLFAVGTLMPGTIKAVQPFGPSDEPGRSPYISQVGGLTSTNCTFYGCSFSFRAVPAGHRLVMQHLSMFIQPKIGSVPARVGLGSTLLPSLAGPAFFATVQGGGLDNIIVVDQPMTTYYDAGDRPTAYMDHINIDTALVNSTQVATLTGYLVECSSAASCSAIVR